MIGNIYIYRLIGSYRICVNPYQYTYLVLFIEAGGVSEELVHAWGEFDQSVATTDSSTSRLAVCNMDWDRVTANDIFVLLSSLTPEKGHIRRVQVFPSEYGAKRLQVEEAVGPGDLMGSEGGEEKGTEDQSETQETERLRRYQLNRLMYYYAIIGKIHGTNIVLTNESTKILIH